MYNVEIVAKWYKIMIGELVKLLRQEKEFKEIIEVSWTLILAWKVTHNFNKWFGRKEILFFHKENFKIYPEVFIIDTENI